MRPIIGVMPLWDEKKNSLWMLPGYLDGIQLAGGTPVIFPFSEDQDEIQHLCGLCSGFLFTGGDDVAPELYREERMEDLVSCCEKRDRMETVILQNALENDKPVLGICRGLQFINVFFGGSLYQDIPLQFPSAVDHHQAAPYDRPAHPVELFPGTPLRQCLDRDNLPVNSCHHQGIKVLAPGLTPMAAAPDGLVEAFYKPDCSFLWAVQWHPEFFPADAPVTNRIFSAFVEACGREPR